MNKSVFMGQYKGKEPKKKSKQPTTYIFRISSFKQNHPTPTISSGQMVPGFIKFNCWNNVNCKKKKDQKQTNLLFTISNSKIHKKE